MRTEHLLIGEVPDVLKKHASDPAPALDATKEGMGLLMSYTLPGAYTIFRDGDRSRE